VLALNVFDVAQQDGNGEIIICANYIRKASVITRGALTECFPIGQMS
jgi:hypothetical protein